MRACVLLFGVCVCVCVCVCVFIRLFAFSCNTLCKSVWQDCAVYCIDYRIQVNMYHASVQGVDERMVNVHCYYCK